MILTVRTVSSGRTLTAVRITRTTTVRELAAIVRSLGARLGVSVHALDYSVTAA